VQLIETALLTHSTDELLSVMKKQTKKTGARTECVAQLEGETYLVPLRHGVMDNQG